MGSDIIICLAGMVMGILFSCKVPETHLVSYLVPLLMAVLVASFRRPAALGVSRRKAVSIVSGFICFFMVGWVSISTNTYRPVENGSLGREIIGKVVSYREVTEKLGQLVIRVKQERVGSIWESRAGKIVLLVKPYKSLGYQIGDWWRFEKVNLTKVSPKPTKNGFIPQRYWLSRGVRYEARVKQGDGLLIKPNRMPSVRSFFNKWQQTLAGRIDRISLSNPSRALIKAMVLGDSSDVDSSIMTDFSRAGIIHVLSVSGLHVGIIYFIIAWMLKRVRFVGFRGRSLAALLVVWIYTAISGFSPSALRSAGMITLFEFSKIGRRGTPGLEVLASTAAIHCIIDPYVVFSAGAELSYLAVAGIFVWNPVFNPLLLKMNRVTRYFAGTISISIAAQCLIIPVLLFWFGWFPLYFLIGNIFLLPLMVFGFYLGLGITVLDFTGFAIPFLCRIMDTLISMVMTGAAWLGNLPGNLFKPGGLVWTDLVLYYFILISIRTYIVKPEPDKVSRMLVGTAMILVVRYGLIWLG